MAPAVEKAARRKKNPLMFLLRAVVSIGLMAYLVFVTVPEEQRFDILKLFTRIDLAYLSIAILLVFADRTLSAWKWLMLLRVRNPEAKALPVIQVFFVTSFLGYLLPSSIGGDALRIYSYGRVQKDLASSAGSVVLDRAYGTLGMLLLGAVSLLLATDVPIPWTDALLIYAAAAGVLVTVLLLSSRHVHRLLERLGGLERGGAIKSKLLRLTEAFSSFVAEKMRLVQVFSFSLGVQVLRVLIVMFLGMSLGLRLDMWLYFAYVPIITAITFLPISLGGLGVRELLFVHFFATASIGVPESTCISLSLLYFTMGIVATIPGAIIYLFTGFSGRE